LQILEFCTSQINTVLPPEPVYTHTSAQGWSKSLITGILKQLKDCKESGYKYIVNVTIYQEGNGRGLFNAQGGFWEIEKDGSVTVKQAASNIYLSITVTWISSSPESTTT